MRGLENGRHIVVAVHNLRLTGGKVAVDQADGGIIKMKS